MKSDSGHDELALSICIATFNRGAFIEQTLLSILPQVRAGVEVVVVNGNSPDDTAQILGRLSAAWQGMRVFNESSNGGVDADYDLAVSRARGRYCWLMTDDDILEDGALETVLQSLSDGPDLVVCNAGMWDPSVEQPIRPRFLNFQSDVDFAPAQIEAAFVAIAPYLSFIGAVVVLRSVWMARERSTYFGSLFIHVGVLFQAPLEGFIRIIAKPQIRIRYGNSMWTPRTFEVWMIKWPELLWSFDWMSSATRGAATPREPWRRLRKIGVYRGIGAYSRREFDLFIAPRAHGWARFASGLVAGVPGWIANAAASAYCLLVNRNPMNAFDLARSPFASQFSRFVARRLGVRT